MSDVPDLFNYTFIWHALGDACQKCASLNGREYRDQDIFQPTLIDPTHGPVWNLDTNQPLTHPNCRCHLEAKVILDFSRWKTAEDLRKAMHKGGYSFR